MIGMNGLGTNGRLGNQMFQYAALVGIAKNRGYDFCIPDHSTVTWFDREVDGKQQTMYHQLQHLFEMNYLGGRLGTVEGETLEFRQHDFSEELFNRCPDGVSLHGYFESYRYFEHVEQEIRTDFTFRKPIRQAAQAFHEKHAVENAVSISVRRGDFLKKQDSHPPCSEAYYRECIEAIGEGRRFVVTSDDIEWCRTVFKGSQFVFNEVPPEGIRKAHFDLCVGTLCSDFIISNSTFSWWMAWLGGGEGKQVLAPMPWYGPGKPYDPSGFYFPGVQKINWEIERV